MGLRRNVAYIVIAVKTMVRAIQERRKAAGICIDCKKAKASPGRVRCADCLAKERIHSKKWRMNKSIDEYEEKILAPRRARRQRLKEAGICVICGKVDAEDGMTRCKACAIRQNAARRESYWRQKRAEEDA